MKYLYIQEQNKYLRLDSQIYPLDLMTEEEVDYFERLESEHKKSMEIPSLYQLMDMYPGTETPAKKGLITQIKALQQKKRDTYSSQAMWTESIKKQSKPLDYNDVEEQVEKMFDEKRSLIEEEIKRLKGQTLWLNERIRKRNLEKKASRKGATEENARELEAFVQKQALKITGADIERAKQVPISTFWKVRSDNKMKCPKHTDRTPSLHVYKGKNTFFCFSCGWRGSVVDIVMFERQVSFSDAVKLLKNM